MTSVCAVAFTADGKIVIVNTAKRGWDLPGGHVEPHENNPVETLSRELMEEAGVTVAQPVLVEVIESDFFDDKKSYMLIYSVLIRDMFDFKATNEISERRVASIEDFFASYEGSDKEFMRRTVLRAKELTS